MIRRTVAFIVCITGVFLPWRLRIVYAEIIAWTVQSLYYLYFSLFRLILENLERQDTRQ